MKPDAKHTRTTAPLPQDRPTAVARWLEAGALLLLLLIAAMRPLVSETYETGLHAIARAIDGGEIVTPARTAWFDLGIWAAAVAATASVALRRGRWRWTGAEAGWALLVLGAVVSTFLASNGRLAANASADWLTTLLLVMLLANLCRDRLRIGLLLAVIVAAGVASAARSAMQVGVEFDETYQQYLETREEFWQRQGVELDDPRVEMFERRMAARQATGFFPHSNTQGALLSLAGFAALACGGLVARRWLGPFMALAAILFAVMLATGSRGALGAAVFGLVLWVALARWQDVLRRRWRATLVGAWFLVALAVAAVLAVGIRTGGLYESSMTFRWQYWQVTRQIVADHLYTGVGAMNFDRAYLLRKPIEYPEEIKDPHNFVLGVAAQWGLLGGIGLAAMLLGVSIVGAGNWARAPGDAASSPATTGRAPLQDAAEIDLQSAHSDPASSWRWILTVAAGFLLLRVLVHRGLWLSGDVGGQALVVFDLGTYALLWVLVFLGIMWVVVRTDSRSPIGYGRAAFCGVIAFLLHNAIDFAIFYPGALTPFAALVGVLLARPPATRPGGGSLAATWGPLAVAAAGLLVFTGLVLLPVHQSARHLNSARAAASLQHADEHYRAAAAADPQDPTPLLELARLHAFAATLAGAVSEDQPVAPVEDDPALALRHLDLALVAAQEAFLRDPLDMGLVVLRSRLLEMRYRLTGSDLDLMGAVDLGRQALSYYPQSPDEHVALADLLARAAAELESPELAAEAAEHYQLALALNDARPGTDEVRRWSDDRRNQIEQRLRRVQLMMAPPSGAD